MIMTRTDALEQIEGSWLLEIGGDVTFRAAYDAMWTNGTPDWTSENFFERFQWMRRMLPKLHPNDIAVLWKVSCGIDRTITIADADGNYIVSA